MTKATVHKDKDKDSLTKAEVAAHAAFPELFKAADPIIVQPKKPLSLETAGSELYAAIMNGEIHNVRRQLAHGDKMTEAEATMMIRARNKAREKGAKRGYMARECETTQRKKKKSGEVFYKYLADKTTAARMGRGLRGLGPAPNGVIVTDSFGGRYTAGGYELPDGSFLSTSGEFFNALNKTLTLSDGKAYKIAEDLPVSMASVVRLAQQVRTIRNSTPVAELEFVNTPAAAEVETAAPRIPAATIALVADAAQLAAKAADARAQEIMQERAFEDESKQSPAGAIMQLDGLPGLSAEDIHMAIQLHRRALKENRTLDVLNERDVREIIDVRDGFACVDTSAMHRCHSRNDHSLISARFNRQPVVIEGIGEMGRSIKACFTKAGNKPKTSATPIHAQPVMA